MLDVYFTIDAEIWCDGWHDLEQKFPEAFERYILGPGRCWGLPDQLQVLSDHGLRAVCFVEPLFAGRFGHAPLAEVVGLIQDSDHEVQLHLHTEWVDEFLEPVLPTVVGKRQHLRQYNLAEQALLIATGSAWLQRAGASAPTAFRAGSFALNLDSIAALAANGIPIDSSYNASIFGPNSGVCDGELLEQPRQLNAVLELPMTVFDDGRGLRHAQLTACSWRELEHLLWQALEQGHTSFGLLSHSFELLAPNQRAPDPTVVKRLQQLCSFLDRHRDSFCTRGLRESPPPRIPTAPPPRLRSSLWRTGARIAEQVWRRRYA